MIATGLVILALTGHYHCTRQQATYTVASSAGTVTYSEPFTLCIWQKGRRFWQR